MGGDRVRLAAGSGRAGIVGLEHWLQRSGGEHGGVQGVLDTGDRRGKLADDGILGYGYV